VSATLVTSQPAGAALRGLFDSRDPGLTGGPTLGVGDHGKVAVSVAPLECIVWQAQSPLPASGQAPSIGFAAPASGSVLAFTARSVDGQVIPIRQEIRADVAGGDGFAEVTFVMQRASRPGQYELLGTADSAPYRVFWRPPADLAPGDELTFIATLDDLRGRRASARIDRMRVAPTSLSFGIRGAVVPTLTQEPETVEHIQAGRDLTLTVAAAGTGPLEFRWLHDGNEIAGASKPALALKKVSAEAAGHYVALVHNREGTAISRDVFVRVDPQQ
jgi:hypothetical protein